MSDDLGALLEEARALRLSMAPGSSAATININAGGWGVAVAVAAVLLSLVAVVMQGQRITDLRSDLQAERDRLEAHQAWAREESNIIRGYIWTGKIPVANPYPKPEPKK